MTDPTSQQPPEHLLEVGRVGRPHGVRGDLYVDLLTDRTERVAVGAQLFIRGAWRTVARSHFHPPRFIVHFEGVDDRNQAALLTGALIHAEPLGELPDVWWVHDLVGGEVIDQHGVSHGRCISVVDNPAHDLLELDSGFLVPVPFIVELDGGIIRVDVPDGLFD